jgi:hypothetical protein
MTYVRSQVLWQGPIMMIVISADEDYGKNWAKLRPKILHE